MSRTWIDVAYLVAAILLIIGVKRLAHPRTARSGNWIAAVGMAIAIGFTFLIEEIDSYWLMLVGHRRRLGGRRALGARGEDDADPADGRAVQRRWRRRGGADRGVGVPPPRAGAAAGSRASCSSGSSSRL